LDEASYSAPIKDDDNTTARIPWDVLVGLFDRLPGSVEERTCDFALVALRVTELFDSAKAWQDEITNNTMLSNRGGKRRETAGSSPVKSRGTEDEDDSNSAKLEMQKIEQLSKNPILSKVRMKRSFYRSDHIHLFRTR
jgi:hypothetical protein